MCTRRHTCPALMCICVCADVYEGGMNIHFGVISSLSLPLLTAQAPSGPRLGQDNQDSEPIAKTGPSGKSLKPVDLKVIRSPQAA